MNDLNLRVAALKLCAHPKRFAEMREAPAPLPTSWQNCKLQIQKKARTTVATKNNSPASCSKCGVCAAICCSPVLYAPNGHSEASF